MRKLTLKRPICFFDLETTGIDIMNDRVVSVSVIKILPDESREKIYYQLNPGMPIPAESSAVHGITDEMVLGSPFFKDIAEVLRSFFKGCDIGGFNCNYFDIPLLSMEFYRVGMNFPDQNTFFVDVGNLFKILNPRTLSAAYKHYTGSTLDEAHNAEADNMATAEVLMNMLLKHEDLPLDVENLALASNHGNKIVDIGGKFKINEQGDYEYAFGKHKGCKICFDNVDYLGWMISKGEFHPDTIAWARYIKSRITGEIDFGFKP